MMWSARRSALRTAPTGLADRTDVQGIPLPTAHLLVLMLACLSTLLQ